MSDLAPDPMEPATSRGSTASAHSFDSPRPAVPDHELLEVIDRGAYGEVWLARNVTTDLRRAVKLVRRAEFEDERPCQREFEGLLKYEPISRSHPGLVQILHIGRNDAEGYFYYVMELADAARERRNAEGRRQNLREAPLLILHSAFTLQPWRNMRLTPSATDCALAAACRSRNAWPSAVR